MMMGDDNTRNIEQFPDRINCVILYLVEYILEYYYDARTMNVTFRNLLSVFI